MNKNFKIGQLVRQEYLGRYLGGRKKEELIIYLLIGRTNEEWRVLKADGTRTYIHIIDLDEEFEVIS